MPGELFARHLKLDGRSVWQAEQMRAASSGGLPPPAIPCVRGQHRLMMAVLRERTRPPDGEPVWVDSRKRGVSSPADRRDCSLGQPVRRYGSVSLDSCFGIEMSVSSLLEVRVVDGSVEEFLESLGEVFVAHRGHDSGNTSYGVQIGADAWFVKHAEGDEPIGHLESAIVFHAAVQHPAIIPLVGWFRTSAGLAIVHEFRRWTHRQRSTGARRATAPAPRVDVRLLSSPSGRRDHPSTRCCP